MYAQFKKLLVSCGINPEKLALHSPRIGGTTGAMLSKVPKHIIDRQGRWKSKKSKYKYARESNNEVAKMFKYIKY